MVDRRWPTADSRLYGMDGRYGTTWSWLTGRGFATKGGSRQARANANSLPFSGAIRSFTGVPAPTRSSTVLDNPRSKGPRRQAREDRGFPGGATQGPTIAESAAVKAEIAAKEAAAAAQARSTQAQVDAFRQAIADERAAARRQANKERRIERRSVYDEYAGMWSTVYGLDGKEIMGALKKLGPNAYRSDWKKYEALKSTKTWGKTFGGVMKMREKKGLAYLNESTIIETRRAYQEELKNLGIGRKRALKYADVWIGSGVSMNEVNRRVDLARDWANNQDANTLAYMRERYGVRKRDLAAYVLDGIGRKNKPMTEWFENQLKEARIGGRAKAYGKEISTGFARRMVERDVSEAEAGMAFQQAVGEQDQYNFYAGLSGQTGFTFEDLAKSNLQGKGFKKGDKTRKLKSQVRAEEQARWSSTAGGAGAGAFGGSEGSY